jgi:hypothetical protein
VELLVADPERLDVGCAGTEPLLRRHDLAVVRPVPVLDARAQDQLGPVGHRDVLALAVDVDVAGDAVRGDREVPPDAVGAEAEVPQRLERSQLDLRPRERLGDDRPGDVARVLARPVVVEHPRDDPGHGEGVVVVHRQEVGGDLGGRVDRLRVDRRALVQDQPAFLVEVVVVGDGLAHVAVLLRGAGGVELLELEAPVHDRLEQVERADRVRHHRFVRPVPRLADVRLRAEVEDVRLVRRRVAQLLDEVVDRRPVGQVGELHLQPVAQVRDVVQRAARRCADECGHVRAEVHERVRQVRSHEAVGARDEHGTAAVDVAELPPELVDRRRCPDRLAHRSGRKGIG